MAEQHKRTRRVWTPGKILQINLGTGRHSYAQLAGEPLVVFFEGQFDREIALEDIPRLAVAFRICVFSNAISSDVWRTVGHQPLAPENRPEPFLYKQDPINGRLALYHSSFAEAGYERPATLEECKGLECAAIWEPEHVIDRLLDHAAGRPNRWVESLMIKVEKIPQGK